MGGRKGKTRLRFIFWIAVLLVALSAVFYLGQRPWNDTPVDKQDQQVVQQPPAVPKE